MTSRESPRNRRLRSDQRALERLQDESSILSFSNRGSSPYAPDFYEIRFNGVGLYREEGSPQVRRRDDHRVTIKLGASYPRMIPELGWKTPIFHPNISASGIVCLGGYGTHWAPSLGLDELCSMLWDMVRYQNYDVESPYNREAAAWTRTQNQYQLPVDPRPIRDKIAAGAVDPHRPLATSSHVPAEPVEPEVVFLDEQPAGNGGEAEVARANGDSDDILFLD